MENIIDFFTSLDNQTVLNLIIAIGIIAVLSLLSPLFSYAIIKIFNINKKDKKIKNNAFYRPLKSFFCLLGIYLAVIYLKPVLNIDENTMNKVTKAFRILVIITTAVGLAKSTTKNSRIVKRIKNKSEKDVDETTLNFMLRTVRTLIYLVATFMVVADLGYDLSGLVTGLGLGSVVITLAAQDTIKNLFGGIIIFLDKPFKVGDYIKFGEYEGTVEDIAFRSTRVRTLDNTLAQISNSEMTSKTIVNISKIEKRRYTLDLDIVLNTKLEDIKKLENKIRSFIESQEFVISNTTNVFFTDIGSSSYKLKIFCYLTMADYMEFLAAKEELNYGIMDIVNKSKIELAYDTKTIEIKHT